MSCRISITQFNDSNYELYYEYNFVSRKSLMHYYGITLEIDYHSLSKAVNVAGHMQFCQEYYVLKCTGRLL